MSSASTSLVSQDRSALIRSSTPSGCSLKTAVADILCFDIEEYLMADGRSPFNEWLSGLGDFNARARVRTRLDRFSLGKLGEYSALTDGIFELRLSNCPGYRVYFGLQNGKVMLLLWGGTEDTRQVDVRIARAYWVNYRRCNGGGQ